MSTILVTHTVSTGLQSVPTCQVQAGLSVSGIGLADFKCLVQYVLFIVGTSLMALYCKRHKSSRRSNECS